MSVNTNKKSSLVFKLARFTLVPIGLIFIVLITPGGIDGQSLLGRLFSAQHNQIQVEAQPNSNSSDNHKNVMLSMTGDSGTATQVPDSNPQEIRVAEDWLQKAGLPKIDLKD